MVSAIAWAIVIGAIVMGLLGILCGADTGDGEAGGMGCLLLLFGLLAVAIYMFL
jgi:hypothetical protein